MRGSLWGLAYGDVVGCPMEGWPAADIAAVFGVLTGVPAVYPAHIAPERRRRLRPLGMHSDDTQQALALINVCAQGFSAAAWGACLVQGAQALAWRGTGRHFDNATKKLASGNAPQIAGSPSAGIGAAMRIAPLGAWYRNQTRRLAEVVMESSAVTHADIRSMALAYAVAWASARFINGATRADVVHELPDAVAEVQDEWLFGRANWAVDRTTRHQFALTLARVLGALPDHPDELARRVVTLGARYLDPAERVPAHANHGFALLGGLNGLCAALLDTAAPHDVLMAIVQQGEDTDTVAAIAGGVLGARFGCGWINTAQINDAAHIESYATALVLQGTAPEPLATLLSREASFTRDEKAFLPP